MTSPVSVLQEKMQKVGGLAHYTITNCRKEDEPPLFMCVVRVGNRSASACGKSKREAKSNAAETILRFLQNDNEKREEKMGFSTEYDKWVKTNYIGNLQTYCQRNLWKLPNYMNVSESETLPKIFEVSCSLGELRTTGKGPSKKEAKHVAAKEMLHIMESKNTSMSVGDEAVPMEESIPVKTNAKKSVRFDEKSNELFVYNKEEIISNAPDILKFSLTSKTFKGKDIIDQKQQETWKRADHMRRTENHYSCKHPPEEHSSFSSSRITAAEVHEKLVTNTMPISDALKIFKISDNNFYDLIDNIADFFDTVMNKVNCTYTIEFLPIKWVPGSSACHIRIKELGGASFEGIADTPSASYKLAVINTLSALSSIIDNYEYSMDWRMMNDEN